MTISRNLSFLAEGVSSTGVLGATYGGTGQSSITTGDLLYGSASNTISKLAIGSTGTVLRVVAGVPSWGTDYTGTVTSVAATVPAFLSISGSPITSSGTLDITYSGTALPIANGGTAQTSFTANQIHYGSFSQSASLYFNGSNLGVGTSSPNASFQATFSGLYGIRIQSADTNNSATNFGCDPGNGYAFIDVTKTGTGSYLPLRFGTSDLERMRISASGGVSIGNTTDPGAGNLSVTGTITSAAHTANSFIPSSATVPTNGLYLPATNSIGWATNSTFRAVIDASGNMGLSVTPVTWRSADKVFEIARATGIWNGGSSAGAELTLVQGIYYNTVGSSSYKRGTTGIGALFDIAAGVFTWYQSSAGAIDTAVTPTTAMTLDTSANLTVSGTITPQKATTAAAPAYVKGAIYFDTTLNKLRVGGATAWETITSV